jgi:hypothetical protein
VIVYGITDAGMADVVKVSENLPPLEPLPVVVVVWVMRLMVTLTVSLAGGCVVPDVNVPLRLIEAVPQEIVCDAVTVLNVVVDTVEFTVCGTLGEVLVVKFVSP